MTEGLRYAYAVVRDTAAPEAALDALTALEDVPGVAGEPVVAVRHQGLAVLAGAVPAEDFDEGPLRERLEDMAWLEKVARTHQRVVDTVGAESCVIPVRLATVCQGEEGLRRLLATGRERFASALDRLEGRVEWGVKAYAATPAPPEPPALQEPPAPDGPPAGIPNTPGGMSGRDYLRRRKAQRQAAEQRWGDTEEGARLVHDTLSGLAERARLHPPQDPRLSGVSDRNVLNAAYLVRREDSAAFAERVGELAGRTAALRVELTGPWAPYSFTAPDENAAAAAPDRAGSAGAEG
ncbi:GvpL/GvpF family gas vesicle protein [Streptomyces melanosporofaciens]|uniref:Gas vesicle synthesis protein GvpL/GvpF n=1 Tax=Streptomyces melanosporofaciens TaxID=67327 RepID=A0A1H4L6F4_STRMJ|nr:GvpL/GvpF family gas vesicle protein [Streptomyces melanosporofaciens]SEB66283.1 Gas vesicle synthesis protein GvpL/GvpF [Streptomyces melanosporofaciens]